MAVKVCPGCGEGNKESAYVCVVCGRSLKDVEMQGTPDSDKTYSGSLAGTKKSAFCSHCREPLEDGALKCKYCRTPVTRTTASLAHSHDKEMPPTPDNTAMTLIVISTILLPFVGLIVGGVASFSDDPNKQDAGKMLLILGLIILIIQFILFLMWR